MNGLAAGVGQRQYAGTRILGLFACVLDANGEKDAARNPVWLLE